MSETEPSCVVCGGVMGDDYVMDGEDEADERRISACETCGWPPKVPFSVEKWRSEWQGQTEEWQRWRTIA